jgi:glycosyltransferase involved in cell wall biosynthesis
MRCGLWVNKDPNTLADAIRATSSMPLPFQDMGQRGREWMQNEFSWHSTGNQIVDLYSRVTERYRGPQVHRSNSRSAEE